MSTFSSSATTNIAENELDKLRLSDITNNLLEFSKKYFPNQSENSKPTIYIPPNHTKGEAGVLIGLFEYENVIYVLLTQRASTMRSHSGEAALPGGKRDPEDQHIYDTALRESMEEVGLKISSKEIICPLPFMYAKSGAVVTPVIATIPTPKFKNINLNKVNNKQGVFEIIPNPEEVDYTYAIPLKLFLSNQFHTPRDITWQNRKVILHTFDISTPFYLQSASVQDNLNENSPTFKIWGLTASICIEAAKIAFNQNPDFTYHPRTNTTTTHTTHLHTNNTTGTGTHSNHPSLKRHIHHSAMVSSAKL